MFWGESDLSFQLSPFGKSGFCFMVDHTGVIGSISLAMLTEICVATGT